MSPRQKITNNITARGFLRKQGSKWRLSFSDGTVQMLSHQSDAWLLLRKQYESSGKGTLIINETRRMGFKWHVIPREVSDGKQVAA